MTNTLKFITTEVFGLAAPPSFTSEVSTYFTGHKKETDSISRFNNSKPSRESAYAYLI